MKILRLAPLVLVLCACEMSAFSDSSDAVKDTANVAYYPDDELLVSAKVQFSEGNYGKSFRMFEQALDVTPKDPAALLGYAASADMLRRFDKADVAYRKLRPTIGNRIEYLNNYGYSLLLRGDLVSARKFFLKAYEKDPANPVTANNLELLRNSVNYPKRGRGDLKGL
ncbi:type IV pilus biogenesis/stability protein PilW [Tritonibacter multivorans]|uniref:Type IV pilus biogenesis/stability protein PilW n=1 Tax=Tritonibacter multivorans TaxID=928856 RepID=A0A0P1FZQ2_9RHOB|nr:tetratricopeptide repeat protein [Tritonibacter multivorans]MDA7422461.1 tetratricopeptide repeat protein [Tritonibacter multivorans]CUH74900.1 type IV pilus biogenesis/stability protein PilW [Tritonibacter multivorans]SFD43358.1 Tetratricopeptide repeat-containing protein [Tritonibacter multivorans]